MHNLGSYHARATKKIKKTKRLLYLRATESSNPDLLFVGRLIPLFLFSRKIEVAGMTFPYQRDKPFGVFFFGTMNILCAVCFF